MMQAMGEMRRKVEETFDYVGDGFAAEARAIHDGKSEDRGIYGEASPKQVQDLVHDGIRVASVAPGEPSKGWPNRFRAMNVSQYDVFDDAQFWHSPQ
jgi:hypothetical protein